MEETAPITPKPTLAARLREFFRPIAENPVILKELRKQMRGRQAYILLFSYLALISIFIALVYGTTYFSNNSGYQWSPDARQTLGKAIFGTIVITELLLIALISPALTSGAIAAERERQTLDLLRTTLLSARALVFGKLGSALSYIFLLIFAAVPLQSVAFLLGGVGLPELLVSSLLLIVTAFFFCALGLFFSSFVKRASVANIVSYALIVISTLTLGVFFFVIGTFFNDWRDLTDLILWFFVSTNPVLAAIFSEVLLIDQQAIFFTTNPPFGTVPFPVPSPWIPYTLLYTIGAIIMVLMSIQFVKRPDRS